MNVSQDTKAETKTYEPLPTMRLFHSSGAPYRCIVGPVGSGKTSAAAWEVDRYSPLGLFRTYGIKQTRWAIVRNCFDDTTEILTEDGWKLFKDLNEDKVAQLSDDGHLEFVLPSFHYRARFRGEMIGFQNEGVDFLVTPNHKLLVSLRNARKKEWSDYRFRKAEVCYGLQNLRVKRDAKWIGKEGDKAFYEWLGFWFAEGYAFVKHGRHYCVITQKNNLEYVRGLFQRASIPFTENDRSDDSLTFRVSVNEQTKPLIEKLASYGKAINKRVPRELLEYSSECLNAWLMGYEAGDGGHNQNGVKELLTSSGGLADDIQEIALRAGWAANINLSSLAGRPYSIHGINGHTNADGYSVTLTRKMHPALVVGGYAGKYRGWYREQYNGMVYCVEVPTHRVYVRRNGKAHWSSQTYRELTDTTQKTVFEWFPWGRPDKQNNAYTLRWPEGFEVEILFRSCDRPGDIKKFKSLELTGYWEDESIEIPGEVKRMLANRIGRFPARCPRKFGIETTNPPDVEHPTYSEFKWHVDPPGPLPPGEPLADHEGFWQPPYENKANLPPNYYEDLKLAYRDYPDWVDMYILGKPGVMVSGKLVYNNFRREYHVAKEPLMWNKGPLYCGWDNSGNVPACVVVQLPGPMRAQVLREYYHDRMNIVDFTKYVIFQMNLAFPGAKEVHHWGDPAGNAQYSTKEGGFTSNATLMAQCGVAVAPSEQNLQARIEAVDQMLGRIEGVLIDPGCTRLTNGFLGGYCYPPNRSLMGEYLPNILKNKYSHPHEALQYVMVRLFKPDLRPDARDPIPALLVQRKRDRYDPFAGSGYDPFKW